MARSTRSGRAKLIQVINTPLSYFVLSLLIVEATLALVLVRAQLEPALRWAIALAMVLFFGANFAVVTVHTFRDPRKLLFGKEEHAAPQIDPAALRDQIEELIARNVRDECLKR